MDATHNYLFVSDLHLSEGRDPKTGELSRLEDFFQDFAFAQFLAYHVNLSRSSETAEYYHKPWTLVINGDIFDFLQVVSLPETDEELFAVRRVQSRDELSSNERRYGLGTRSSEVVWKLQHIAAGHPLFFQALGWFVAHPGNRLLLLKGNHDVETHWPEVQQCLRHLLAGQYETWYQEAQDVGAAESPLPLHEGMPPTLDEAALQTSVEFPASSYSVAGVFYVEHGCQYDPVNSFSNFENPTLTDQPELIELPSGSFFVRYFFNEVEVIHPFADNIKPLSRYFNWVVKNAPTALLRVLYDIFPSYLRAYARVQRKQISDFIRKLRGQTRAPQLEMVQMQSSGRERPMSQVVEDKILEIQTRMRRKVGRASKAASIGTVTGLVLRLVSLVLFLLALRHFVYDRYVPMVVLFVAAVGAAFLSSILSRWLDHLLETPYLQEAATEICQLFNRPDNPAGNVPYFIFGHDHMACYKELKQGDGPLPPYRQWYVNTGSWIPVFSEEDRLLRDAEHLTFLRLTPGDPEFGQGTPELWQWWPEANRPRKVRQFEDVD